MALSPSVAARLRHITAALAPTGTADSSPPAASADATTIVSASTASAVAAAAPEPACLDYAYSFITNPGPLNAVRFWIESRTTLFDDEAGTCTVIYQCASCKSENTFGASDLFYPDNYDFCPVISVAGSGGSGGSSSLLIFRRSLGKEEANYRDLRADASDTWGEPKLHLRPTPDAYEIPIDDFEAIAKATADAVPLVSQTEIWDESTKLRAIIECPVKTMNIALAASDSWPSGVWQIDTGPVAVPDLSRRYDPPLDSVSLGYIATNNRQPDAADFVLEQHTPLPFADGGNASREAATKVLHFSNPYSLPARNRLIAIPVPPLP